MSDTLNGAAGCASGKGGIGCASGKGFQSGCKAAVDCGIPCAGGAPGDGAVNVPQCNAAAQIVGTQFCLSDITSECFACGDGRWVKITPSGVLSSVLSGSGTTWTATGVATATYYDTAGCDGDSTGSSQIDATLTLSVDGDNNLVSGDLVLASEDGIVSIDSGTITFGCKNPREAVGSVTLTEGSGCVPGPFVITVVLCLGYVCFNCPLEFGSFDPQCWTRATVFSIKFDSVVSLHPAGGDATIIANMDALASFLSGLTWEMDYSLHTISPLLGFFRPSDCPTGCDCPSINLCSGTVVNSVGASFTVGTAGCQAGSTEFEPCPDVWWVFEIDGTGAGSIFGAPFSGSATWVDIENCSAGALKYLSISATISVTNQYCEYDADTDQCVSIFDDGGGGMP